jgi:iron complex transport system substrate-binding protein
VNAQRIVSLAPSNTEILFALGLGNGIVGVTEFCDYPQEARLKEKIGGFSTVDVKKVISLRPDLVLATDFHLSTIVPQLKSKGVNVLVIETKTLLDAPQCIARVGEITGHQNEAYQLAKSLREQIRVITEQTKQLSQSERPKVCYLCCDSPLSIARSTCPPNTLIEIGGGVNIGRDILRGTAIDLEAIVNRDPEVFITSKGHGETTDLLSYVRNEPLLSGTPARQNNRVYQISADLICRTGPRAGIGLREIAKYIHPEIFGNPEEPIR